MLLFFPIFQPAAFQGTFSTFQLGGRYRLIVQEPEPHCSSLGRLFHQQAKNAGWLVVPCRVWGFFPAGQFGGAIRGQWSVVKLRLSFCWLFYGFFIFWFSGWSLPQDLKFQVGVWCGQIHFDESRQASRTHLLIRICLVLVLRTIYPLFRRPFSNSQVGVWCG